MTSLINPSNPTEPSATTASVRANFQAAKDEIEALQNIIPLLEIIYPVGTIYITTINSNPNALLNLGTWVRHAVGRALVGYDSTQAEFDAINETGGSKTVTLTSAQMPVHTHIQNSHTHTVTNSGQITGSVFGNSRSQTNTTLNNASVTSTTATNQNAGSGAAHSNLQPYIVVFCWLRTA